MAYRRKDGYWRRAKKEGYRSRAAYKLMQLNKKFGLIRKGDTVLDVGCAPGGWMQVAREIVGESGYVLGVDLQNIPPFEESNVEALQADITRNDILTTIKERKEVFDVVISDISPNISGIWDVDHFRSVELSEKALGLAVELLRSRGNFLVKVFQGEGTQDFFAKVKAHFSYTKVSSPEASRKSSAEVYIIGKHFV
ncbi:MAG: 23S rRNA (uridine(2552)-2'-O)-methyltransferase [Theionarchaea archaeon]|nr:23S rRNA (uridine(2552)-2'-O)-methyltransferase [Theionarchaea archaeon]MBU7039022.1 23S rRNA (uridine(2552)-2'-O)-methyltransferase [Theionarchaea archaeon]